ncbi:MAG: DUF6786 family protein, partial [Ginsengibacter sp.]
MYRLLLYCVCCALVFISCGETNNQSMQNEGKDSATVSEKKATATYAYDRDFLKKYVSVIELQQGASRVLLSPQYQGRVMTSSTRGDSGYSFGWVNYGLIESKKTKEHINAFGGEERLWLSPEGGQFSFFFKKNDPFDFEHWFTPKEFDTEPFDVISQSDTSVLFKKDVVLNNRSENNFVIHIDRKITLLDKKKIEANLKIDLGNDISAIAYESENTLVNKGKNSWTK